MKLREESFKRIVYFDSHAFHLSAMERLKALNEIALFRSYSPHSASLSYADEVESLIRYVDRIETEAQELGVEGAQLAETMVRAFLSFYRSNLEPTTQAHIRGKYKAAPVDFSVYREAAKFDPIAFDVTCDIASMYIRQSSEIRPDVIAFVVDLLRRDIQRPKEKRGVSSTMNYRRDKLIVDALEVGRALGLMPTRNDATLEQSGCDVVAGFLREMGMQPATFSSVKRVWLTRGDKKTPF
ncbi:hypothetical protein ACFO5X_25735 [Seohaeicola nanhaiensis]|uniref:DUF3800 domain-containing protein n=1 Tax=Seohaeicola nanhaiensis TaxID=1387282 RepID=A0ABV9KQL5_9RHOB